MLPGKMRVTSKARELFVVVALQPIRFNPVLFPLLPLINIELPVVMKA